jgi:thiol-disulfide isomerase/thioredoxin
MAGVSANMPSLSGATGWLNSEPLAPDALRGHVVLVDFWTLTCINWLRTEPYVRGWSRAYRDDGLIVLGVHTPEFGFEHDPELVRMAIAERDIDYPVAIDNDYAVWRAFDNHYWPALYFVDRDGIVRESSFGEGGYERDERLIQALLGIQREPVSVEGRGIEAEADWDHLATPETYLGFGRGSRFASPEGASYDEQRSYTLPRELPSGHWALDGSWTINRESVAAHAPGSAIAFRFSARDVHLVLSSGAAGAIRLRVTVDGESPGQAHGVDVDEHGEGLLREGRLYQLVREAGSVRERTARIEFLDAGAAAYAFTFG